VRVFGLGRTDGVTAQWAAAQLGSRTLYTESHRSGAGDRADTRSEVRDRLLTADQLQELPPDRLLCFIRSHRVLLLDRILSHRHPAYRGKLDPNPTRRA
jgi:type IV secretion system protein VirD4